MNSEKQSNGDEHLRTTILISLAFLGTGSLIHLARDKAMEFISTIAWYHVKIVLWFSDLIPFNGDIDNSIPFFTDSLLDIEPYLNPSNVFGVDPELWWKILQEASVAFLVIYLLPTMLVIWLSFGRRPDLIFRNRYSLDSLWETQPIKGTKVGFLDRLPPAFDSGFQIGSTATENVGHLINTIHSGSKSDHLEPALSPEEWLISEGLIPGKDRAEKLTNKIVPFDQKNADELFQDITIDGINEVLEDNMGSIWNGFESLNNYEKGLVAALILHYDFQQGLGRKILLFLNATFDVSYPDKDRFEHMLGGDRWLQDKIQEAFNSEAGRKLENKALIHGWKSTALVTILRRARLEGGVLPTANFLWLKLIDRTLWYTLNNAGNAVSSIESAGVHAHFRAEIQSNIPLLRKNVFQASRSLLEDYLGMKQDQLARRKLQYNLVRPIGNKLREYAETSQSSI
ncbi:MAG: hypothetical protein OXH65_07455 [Paracoccaceae bacterium]|nr:hypothetical protein [Paracoccaceae bacterium]MDE2674928.1 hypothetical protein [Paracoccaceae bacterium]MYG09703.1 hypothetical protein [Paracoccaceae bacterium]MYJ87082.1 hypothetical protein [Paracoccaceae bacterium]